MLGKPQLIGRAGVSLGRIPAIVTVTDPASAAAHASLRTGDAVTALASGDQRLELEYFPQLLRALAAAWNAGADSVDLTVAQAAIPGAEKQSPETGQERYVSLSLEAVRGKKFKNSAELAAALGITDSTLTVGLRKGSISMLLHSGDRILSWNGEKVRDVFHLYELLDGNKNPEVRLSLLREFKEKTLRAHPLSGEFWHCSKGVFITWSLDQLPLWALQ